jgi:Ca-activated chloride channel homolog
MKIFFRLAVLGLFLLPSGAVRAVFAQEAVFRSDSRLVVLHVTVTDQEGTLVTDLPKPSFRVLENGTEQEIKVFRREDVPVSLGMVLDDSASMAPKRDRLSSAALAMVKASHPDDEVFILNFNDKNYLDTDFTHSVRKMEEGLSRIDARGTTAMRDAVRLAIEHLQRKGKEDKKVLVVITDGEDNTSHIGLDSVVKSAEQSGVVVYTVGLTSQGNSPEAVRARKDLDALAKATGGQAYHLSDIAQVGDVAARIARDIRNQYTIAYSPSEQALDGTYREIKVLVTDPARPVLTVRTRTGYYASPATTAQNVEAPAARGR